MSHFYDDEDDSMQCSIGNECSLVFPLNSTTVYTTDQIENKDLSYLHISDFSSIGGNSVDMSSHYFSKSLLRSRNSECSLKSYNTRHYNLSAASQLNSRQSHFELPSTDISSIASQSEDISSDTTEASMRVLKGSFQKDEAKFCFKQGLSERPECIGQEIQSFNASNGLIETSQRSLKRNFRTMNINANNESVKANSPLNEVSDHSQDTTVNSDSSIFMGQHLCCVGIKKTISKDKKRSITSKLKKFAKQIRNRRQPGLGSDNYETIAVL